MICRRFRTAHGRRRKQLRRRPSCIASRSNPQSAIRNPQSPPAPQYISNSLCFMAIAPKQRPLLRCNSEESCNSKKVFATKERKDRIDKHLCCFSLRSLCSFAAVSFWLRLGRAGRFEPFLRQISPHPPFNQIQVDSSKFKRFAQGISPRPSLSCHRVPLQSAIRNPQSPPALQYISKSLCFMAIAPKQRPLLRVLSLFAAHQLKCLALNGLRMKSLRFNRA